MVWTGAGQIVFLGWLGIVWVGYYAAAGFVDPWVALGGACAAAAIATYGAGRALDRSHAGPHTFCGVPARWVGLAAPLFFGMLFGVAELLRRL